MVAMQMGDEDGAEACELDMRQAQLRLGALATIYHEAFAADFYYLRRTVMFQCWCGATATEDMNSEWFHGLLLLSLVSEDAVGGLQA